MSDTLERERNSLRRQGAIDAKKIAELRAALSDAREELSALRVSSQAQIATARNALERADQFITNGIALGFIRMPDPGTPDSAHATPEIIRAALSNIRTGDSTPSGIGGDQPLLQKQSGSMDSHSGGVAAERLPASASIPAPAPAGQSEAKAVTVDEIADLIVRTIEVATVGDTIVVKARGAAKEVLDALLPAGSASLGGAAKPSDDAIKEAIFATLVHLQGFPPIDTQLGEWKSAVDEIYASSQSESAAHPTVKVSGDAAFARFSNDEAAVLPDGYKAPLPIKSTFELVNEAAQRALSGDAAEAPTAPGWYWAKWKSAAPGTREGTELTLCDDWCVVEVWDNYLHPDCGDGEFLGVSVTGLETTQWLENFEWGPRIADLRPRVLPLTPAGRRDA